MTDTSSGSGFGGAGAKIRLDLKRRFGGGGRGSGGGGGKRRKKRPAVQPEPAPTETPVVTEAIWRNLYNGGRLEAVLRPPEILYYLREMARLIEAAKFGDLAEYMKEFEIRETSSFNILRRRIGNRAPGNAQSDADGSEHHNRAGGAFLVGSKDWAEELTKQDDPTQVLVSDLVKVIRDDNFARALVLSARLILQDYGQRVIRRSIRKDDAWGEKAAQAMIDEYHTQLGRFFTSNNSAAKWRSSSIEATLEGFPPFLGVKA